MGAPEGGFAAGQSEVQGDGLAGGAFDLGGTGVGDDLDTFVLEELLKALDNVGIFAVSDAGVALDDGDAGTEAAHGLCEFKTDEAAAEDEQMLRKDGELKGFDVGEGGSLGEAGNRFDGGAGAGIDKDVVGAEGAGTAGVEGDFDGLLRDEAAEAHHNLSMAFGVVGEMNLQVAIDQLLAMGVDAGHIDVPVAVDHAELRATAEVLSNFGAVDYVLAGKAGDVGAGPADALVFDVDDVLPK